MRRSAGLEPSTPRPAHGHPVDGPSIRILVLDSVLAYVDPVSTDYATLVRQAHQSYAAGDIAAILSLVDPDLEWTYLDPAQADPEPQVFHGRHELEHALERQRAQGLHSELEEVIGQGDRLVVVTRTPGVDAYRARQADDRNVDVLTFRAGGWWPSAPAMTATRHSSSPGSPEPILVRRATRRADGRGPLPARLT
ncbi:MAG: nuclear transport factor 2 family protein [Chloroflexi bacterium]|nr:nuclear transport factor 2 family protein [Chloroflexota bacterium]